MTEYSRFFGGPEGSVPEYTQPNFAEVLEKIFSDGVFENVDNELEVVETDPAALAVRVNTGEAWIQGFWYQNTAYLTKSLAAADPDNDRIDRIVLRLDTTTNFKISVEVLTGTPAGSPSAPALTQTAAIYEISLAQVLVEEDVTSVSDAKITDERTFSKTTHAPVLEADLTAQSLTVSSVTTETANTLTPTRGSKRNAFYVTALDDAAEIQAVSGTPAAGDTLLIGIKASGGDRAITWTASYVAIGGTLLASATSGKWIYMIFVYNGTDSKWHMMGEPVEEA